MEKSFDPTKKWPEDNKCADLHQHYRNDYYYDIETIS